MGSLFDKRIYYKEAIKISNFGEKSGSGISVKIKLITKLLNIKRSKHTKTLFDYDRFIKKWSKQVSSTHISAVRRPDKGIREIG